MRSEKEVQKMKERLLRIELLNMNDNSLSIIVNEINPIAIIKTTPVSTYMIQLYQDGTWTIVEN